MKLKYNNFKHYAASAPEPTYVPPHLIRKHWSMQVIEFCHFTFCLICLGIILFSFRNLTAMYFAITVFIFLTMLIPCVLSIMDNFHFRKAYVVSHALHVILVLAALPLNFALILVLISSAILIVIHFVPKNKSYFEWCKSIAN